MSATYELFTLWKKAKGLTSDNAGALELGITRGTVSLWKQGRNAGVDVIERMARDLGADPAAWAALTMAEQTQGDASRAWSRIARQLGAAAAILIAVALPGHANAATHVGMSAAEQLSELGIMRSVRSMVRRLQAWLRCTWSVTEHGPSALLA